MQQERMSMSAGQPVAAGRFGIPYHWKLVFILSLAFGVVFFDRNAVAFLTPYIKEALDLSAGQIGLLSSALSLTWAISGYLIGAISDATGKRKAILVPAFVLFSLTSILSGLATSFFMLFIARMLMGLSEGPVNPIAQSITSANTPPEQRGMAMGVMQNFGSNLLGSFVAPLVIVGLAEAFGWRTAFYVAAIPGFIMAAIIAGFVRDGVTRSNGEGGGSRISLAGVMTLFAYRNVVLCVLITIVGVSYMVLAWVFMPLYYIEVKGYDSHTMSWLMAILGLSAAATSFVVPWLSDRLGRKPVVVLFGLVGIFTPLSVLYFQGTPIALGCLVFVFWSVIGTLPITMSTIPAETVPAQYLATVMGLTNGLGEAIGGVCSPAIAGFAADHYGLAAPLWIAAGCSLLIAVFGLMLQETAPGKTRAATAAA
ncbi:MFS transporter [Salinisphaera orenii MK-B5]|uniref:MFS transporter n=1 Tax=Salinisphaera orenii MK-B5 TaxID=856730 RepID=A0A423PPX7_9GAMM|nr:MFS transporter [Salinisphaera orenii]ROO27627.1 MFS transporter [Salinisphaera orenii MK-B5]